MKAVIKIIIALAVCATIGAQIWYSKTLGSKAPAPAKTIQTVEQPAPARPQAENITTIILSSADGGNPVWLAKTGEDWRIETVYSVPADAGAVNRFLSVILGDAQPVETSADTGTAPEQGVLISLGLAGGEAKPYMILGLRPDDSYTAAYARLLDTDTLVLLPGDVRGDMGLWKNTPGALPESDVWLDKRVFAFDPAEAVELSVVYPDHQLDFTRGPDNAWQPGTNPGGGENAAGLEKWLRDLADFRITEVGEPGNRAVYGLGAPSHSLRVRLADGTEKTIAACTNRMGDGMWVETSDVPGQVFYLPGWRFQFYFQRAAELFPQASPRYHAEDIQVIDIRRGGESVKLTRRDGEWGAVATPYPLKKDRIIRLATVLSSWRPDDIADARARQARPLFGGPLVEVTLQDGTVHQYRLGGRHPVFPWRYVLVDGKTLLSAADADIASIFPEFAEFLELGMVFGDLALDQVTRLELSAMDQDGSLISAGQTASGEWEAVTDTGRTILDSNEVDGLIRAPFTWKVAGFYRVSESDRGSSMLLLRLSGGGAEKQIVIFEPQDRDVPYVDENDETFLVERAAFFTWLGTLRGIHLRLEAEAEERLKIEEEQAVRDLENAEAEALSQAIEEEERAKAVETLQPPAEPETPEITETPEIVEPVEESVEEPVDEPAQDEPLPADPEPEELVEEPEPAASEVEDIALSSGQDVFEQTLEKAEETDDSSPKEVETAPVPVIEELTGESGQTDDQAGNETEAEPAA